MRKREGKSVNKPGIGSEFVEMRKQDHATSPRIHSWWYLLSLLVPLAVILFCIYSWNANKKIAGRQKLTTAVIHSHDPSNYDRYGYEFSLNGVRYSGWAYPSDKRKYWTGETITVYYDPLAPETNSSDDFDLQSVTFFPFIAFCFLPIAGFPLLIFLRRRITRNSASNGN
jgi:hypothetical protein